MKKNKIIIYFFPFIFVFLNCYKYDYHPEYLRGTKFYAKETLGSCDSEPRIIISANRLGIGLELVKFDEPIYEYFLFSFFIGKFLGSYNNGNLNKDDIDSKANYRLKDNEIYIIEVNNISYNSSSYLDLILDYLPGAYFRLRRYNKKFTIKVADRKDLINIEQVLLESKLKATLRKID